MNMKTLQKKIQKCGFELLNNGTNEVAEFFKFEVKELTFSFCVSNDIAGGFRCDFKDELPSFYGTANEMLKRAIKHNN